MIVIADQQHRGKQKDRVAVGYCNERQDGVAIYVSRNGAYGQMLLTNEEATALLEKLSALEMKKER